MAVAAIVVVVEAGVGVAVGVVVCALVVAIVVCWSSSYCDNALGYCCRSCYDCCHLLLL